MSSTKTDAGIRDIPINEMTKAVLEEAIRNKTQNKLDLLFYDSKNKSLISPQQVNCYFHRLCKKAGIEERGQHALRHYVELYILGIHSRLGALKQGYLLLYLRHGSVILTSISHWILIQNLLVSRRGCCSSQGCLAHYTPGSEPPSELLTPPSNQYKWQALSLPFILVSRT